MSEAEIRQPISTEEALALDRDYLTRTACSRQWRAFVAALALELHLGSGGGAEVRFFLRAVGARMAAALPLAEVETLEGLEAEMNRVWSEIQWGWVRLSLVDDRIRIVHGAYPNANSEDAEQIWPHGAAGVLEGIYSTWLEAQGSPGALTVQVGESIRPLEFHHGH